MSEPLWNYEITNISQHGASLYFRLSRNVRKLLALKKGDVVSVSVVGDEIRVRKVDLSAIAARMPANGETEE